MQWAVAAAAMAAAKHALLAASARSALEQWRAHASGSLLRQTLVGQAAMIALSVSRAQTRAVSAALRLLYGKAAAAALAAVSARVGLAGSARRVT
ncbi:hypothetical protein T492DRAFT_897412, partial [Pavlovales sp. CCMP2436]